MTKAYRTYLLGCCAGMLLPFTAHAAPGAEQPAAASAPQATITAEPPAPAAQPADKEIVITGTRLGISSFTSPTPVNVVGQERVQNLAISNVGDALNQIPAFRPLVGPTTNSFRASQNISARNLDLRGLGPTRTLTLVDGRRTVPSSDDGTFDLNAVPSIMVKRSEVVTGGASAAYGADAVAGVVNLILDTRFTGLKAEASYGQSQRGDARNYAATFKAGTTFAGGRGHLVVGGEYQKEGGVGDFNSRAWGRRYYNFIPNPFFSTNPALSNGLPANVAISNVLYAMNPSGVISAVSPLQGMQFDTNGNLVPFQFGTLYNTARPSSLMVGGDPSVKDAYGAAKSPIIVPAEHYSGLAHVEYELSDRISANAEVSYAKVIGGPTDAALRSDQNGAIRITRDNAYLTADTLARMIATGATVLPVSRVNAELGGSKFISRNQTIRANIGLKGSIGSSWKWDAYYDYGKTWGDLDGVNQRITDRWTQAVDAVFVTAANRGTSGLAIGSIVCRTTLTNPTNGCVPVNVMGPNKISAAGVAWVNSIAWQNRTYTQSHVAANAHGTLFHGWAGDISAALGAEYRSNVSVGDADGYSATSAFQSTSATVLPRVAQRVTEGYGEINIPLLRDLPFAKSLAVDGAVRRTHYSLSGDATTWKVGGVYEPSDEFMFRVTRSHDIRAPSALELNPSTRGIGQNQSDPKYNISYVILNFTGGNPNLKLETANTFTAGAVFKPSFLPGFRLSVDYYNIRVTKAIDVISVTQAIQLCRAGTLPGVCNVGTDTAGNPDRILAVFATYQNVNQLKARGLEFVSNYTFRALDGTVDIAVNGNYVDTLSTTLPDGSIREFSNVTGNAGQASALFGVPRWRADSVITYSRPTWGVTTQFQYIPKGTLSRDFIGPDELGYTPYLTNSINNNRVAGSFYVNLSGRVKLYGNDGHKVELFGSINNLFDKDPPSNLRLNGNPVYFDNIGRAFKVGLRADW